MSYNKKVWKSGDRITKEALNNMENGIEAAHQNSGGTGSAAIVDNLNSDSSTSALSAKQGKALNNKIPTKSIVEGGKIYLAKEDGTKLDSGTELPVGGSTIEVVNNLESDSTTAALSAAQGKVLNTQYKDIANLKNSTNVVNLEKYNITQADYTTPFTVENYNTAHQNGLGFQQAIDEAKEKNIQELIIPPGNYPLCYNASKKDERNAIINSERIDIIADGCKFYVIYDEEGINPYYSWTDDELTANNNVKNNYLLMGYVFKTDRNIIGAEIIGERAYRQNEKTKYRDSSYGIILSALSDNNIIKNCKIHHISGDGIGSDMNFGVYNTTAYISGNIECPANNMVNGEIVSSVNSWLSPRMGIGYSVDTTKPTHICATGYNYFIWTAKPLEIHCFTQDEVFIKTITVEQGNYFYLPNGTFYVHVTMYSGGTLTSDSKATVNFRFGNAKYYGTTIEGCELYANQRGGISNPPSEVVIKNCCIHDNGGVYDGMVAYYDGTQFGLDIEDWYINRATIDSCLFYNNLNDILHRCHDLVIKNSTFKDGVASLNYAVDIHFEHSNFYGNVTLNTPAQFGTKVAIGCYFNGSVNENINIIKSVNEYTLPVATSETLGGVKPIAKTDKMTQAVGVTEEGLLYTTPSTVSESTDEGAFKKIIETTFGEDCYSFTVTKDKDENLLNLKEGFIFVTASQPKDTSSNLNYAVGFQDWVSSFNLKANIYNIGLFKNYEFYRYGLYFRVINNHVFCQSIANCRTGTTAPKFNNFSSPVQNSSGNYSISNFKILHNNLTYVDSITVGLDMSTTGLFSKDSIMEVWAKC